MEPYRDLASEVLLQCWRDALAGDTLARMFLLQDSPMRRHWCALAKIEPDYMAQQITGQLRHARLPPPAPLVIEVLTA